jgi:GMP synthase (glutamine-hydrolysing)
MSARHESAWCHKINQTFAYLIANEHAGNKGDQQHHGHMIALHAVSTANLMTATATPLPFDYPEALSGKIINQILEIARLVYQ